MFAKGKPTRRFGRSPKEFHNKNNQSQSDRSFDTASGLLRKTVNTSSQLKQTKLSLSKENNKLIYEGFVADENLKFKLKQRANVQSKNSADPIEQQVTSAPLSPTPLCKPGRNLVSLIGRVTFCLNMHKMYPKLDVIWNVYGKLLRVMNGKNQEHTLLIRDEDRGPILQAIYYDFEDFELRPLANGCFLHIVGRFIGENRLQTFRLEQVSNENFKQDFVRLENLTSYILMQSNTQD